jgi:hypothetical protein
MEEFFVFLVFALLIFGITYIYLFTRNKERMALIEKGANASLFYSEKKRGTSTWVLKLGVFFIGIAIGTLIGAVLEATTLLPEEVNYLSMIFLFGGLSLVVYYLVERKILSGKED